MVENLHDFRTTTQLSCIKMVHALAPTKPERHPLAVTFIQISESQDNPKCMDDGKKLAAAQDFNDCETVLSPFLLVGRLCGPQKTQNAPSQRSRAVSRSASEAEPGEPVPAWASTASSPHERSTSA